jgi:hypothetical protein
VTFQTGTMTRGRLSATPLAWDGAVCDRANNPAWAFDAALGGRSGIRRDLPAVTYGACWSTAGLPLGERLFW